MFSVDHKNILYSTNNNFVSRSQNNNYPITTKQNIKNKYNCVLVYEAEGCSHTYNVSSEVNVGEFLVDVLDGRLHGFIRQVGWPRFRVCTDL